MSPLQVFLDNARRQIELRRARLWALRGLAVTSVAIVAVLLFDRWHPLPSQLPVFIAVLVAGVLVATAGWAFGRPTLAEVARVVDRRLGGQERLSTALELAAADSGLALANPELFDQQRADAEKWASTADPRQAAPPGIPRRELAVVVGAAALAALLFVVPNASRARQEAAAAEQAIVEEAAEEIEEVTDELSQGRPGENAARRQALVRELRQAREALLDAKGVPAGVAALSKAQSSLQALADPSTEGRATSAAAAGAELAKSGAGAEAGAAMSKSDGQSAEDLEELASALPSLSEEEKAAAAAQLAEAAKAAAASSPDAAKSLSQAAEALASGQPQAAAAALAQAAQAQQQQAAAEAAQALEQLGESLPTLSPEQAAELARALQEAAAAAAADPALAEALRDAANAMRDGKTDAADAALAKAGERTKQLDAESKLDSDVSRASNALQKSKAGMLSKSSKSKSTKSSSSKPSDGEPQECGDMAGHDHMGGGHDMGGAPTTASAVSPRPTAVAPTVPTDEGGGEGCEGSESESSKSGRSEGEGGGAGEKGGKGAGGAGKEGAEGAGGGKEAGGGAGKDGAGGAGGAGGKSPGGGGGAGGGGGQGPGDGSAGEGGGNRGGGGGGASGQLGQAPGLPSEQVYIPGITGVGRTQSKPGGSSSGADTPLVPYETVYSQYRSEALSQADRQLIPERLREWLRLYFQEAQP